MKYFYTSMPLLWLMSFVIILLTFVAKAETKIPCYIFSGKAETNYCINLQKLNRITFGNNSLIVSSSNKEEQTVELQYTLYNHIEIGDAIPTDLNGVDTTLAYSSNSSLSFDQQLKFLKLQSNSDALFSITIFDISGRLLLSSILKNGDTLTLKSLTMGEYVAVASAGSMKLNLKFIIN